MAAVTTYDHGTPCWPVISTGHPDLAGNWYREFFNWLPADSGAMAGQYTLLCKEGRVVAGLRPADLGTGTHWSTYVSVDDAHQVAAKARVAGGSVLSGPFRMRSEGRTAILRDPTGTLIPIWEPGIHGGAQTVRKAGALTWLELVSEDVPSSTKFYGTVFGWSWLGGESYLEAYVGDHAVAGVMPQAGQIPVGPSGEWLTYFGSDDIDSDYARATQMGATTFIGPADIPGVGRFTVLVDPLGAVFGLLND